MPKDIVVQFVPEHAGKSTKDLDPLVDAEVERFSRFMEGLKDWKAAGALEPAEKALLKSYLVAAVTGKLDNV